MSEPGAEDGIVQKVTLTTIFVGQQQTLREIAEVKGELRGVRDRTDDILKTQRDHEDRIRSLEKVVVPEERILDMAKERDGSVDSLKERVGRVEERALTTTKVYAFLGALLAVATAVQVILLIIKH